MTKRLYLLIILFFFLYGCKIEYKPTSYIPKNEAGIEEVFPDSISNLKGNIKFEFMNDSCKSISATYGENKDIYVQIFLVNYEVCSNEDCIEDYVMPYFDDFKKVRNYVNGFYATTSDDNYSLFTWDNADFVFFISCKNELLENFVYETEYITLK